MDNNKNNQTKFYANEVVEVDGFQLEGSVLKSYTGRRRKLTLPEGITAIGTGAFFFRYNVVSITIPKGVTAIGSGAFCFCSKLASINIPEGVTTIDDEAFLECWELEHIQIPKSVFFLSGSAFRGCDGLTSLQVAEGNEVYYSAGNCIIETETNTLVCGCKTSVIPDGVTAIGAEAFSFNTVLRDITIPESVTMIDATAFENCWQVRIHAKIGSYAAKFAMQHNISLVAE